MKKSLLFIVFALFMFKSNFAAYSTFSLRLFDNSGFVLIVDNMRQINQTGEITVRNLTQGNHDIQVIKKIHSNQGLIKTVLYSGIIFIPKNMKVFAVLTKFNFIKVINQIPIQPDYFVGDEDNCHGNHDNYYVEEYGMNANEFNNLKMLVSNSSFDDSKLTIAKQAASSNRLRSQQVLELMNSMTFEATKLEFAKFAYRNVLDPKNFYIVNQGFAFSSSIDELNRFIVCN